MWKLPQLFCKQCTSSDFKFEYTVCDKAGQRWRVAVPKVDDLQCENGVPIPEKGPNCSFACNAGTYLDINNQRCRLCSKGTYSLAGGLRFDAFDELPEGFVIENLDTNFDSENPQSDSAFRSRCSPKKGWIMRNSELFYVPSPCISKLIYSVDLARNGYVEYFYRMPRNSRGLVFNIDVKNAYCRSNKDEFKQLMVGSAKTARNKHDGGEWHRERVQLNPGHNVITWIVISYRDALENSDLITISRIDITGLGTIEECKVCPAGTYSLDGAKECKPCPANSYSLSGSARCTQCPSTHFSRVRSSHCIKRPQCSLDDYYPQLQPCINGRTKTVFVKLQSSVCLNGSETSFEIPKESTEIACPLCNPGMFPNSNGQCDFCSKNYYSLGDQCRKCPVDTFPNYGLQYIVWNHLPPNMFTKCEYIVEGGSMNCDIADSWFPAGNAIKTSSTQERGIAFELGLRIEHGFSNPLLALDQPISSSNPIASITFDFSTKCASETCALYLIEDLPAQSYYRLIADFNGTQPYRTYFHPIESAQPTAFIFIFIRSGSSTQEDVLADQAFIYRINVTNVNERAGGASTCLQCPKSNGKCVQCLAGEYISENTNECNRCPNGLVLNISSDRLGLKSCIPCGLNLISVDSVHCISSGFFKLFIKQTNRTHSFNFTYFSNRTLSAAGVKVFAHEGTSYFHSYNISLLSQNGATCQETYFMLKDKNEASSSQAEVEKESAVGYVCRSTALPVRRAENTSQNVLYISPTVIADKLLAIKAEPRFDEFVNLNLEQLQQSSDSLNQSAGDHIEVHFLYGSSSAPSQHCPNGIQTIITMRCDSRQSGQPKVLLPDGCLDGTCDGCLYQIIIASLYACPICDEQDLKSIRGECVSGKQIVHKIAANYCISVNTESDDHEEACSVLPFRLQLLIFVILIILLFVCIATVMVYRKNRSLEYKYMKLVEWKDSKKGSQMSGAESCALGDNDDGENDDDEDDDEEPSRVFFSRKKRSNRVLSIERRLFLSNHEKDDGGRMPFAALEETDGS